MSRILLIKCANLPRYERTITFPLGVMYIASVLRDKGHEVRILDLRLFRGDNPLPHILKDFAPDLVGLSALSVESSSLHSTSYHVKNISPRTIVIAGGPYPTSDPHEVLHDPYIDYLVLGEGEETVLELVEHALGGETALPFRE